MGNGKRKIYHYHIRSKNLNEKGVFELTFNVETPSKLVLKIADDRKTIWSINAMKQFLSSLNKSVHL